MADTQAQRSDGTTVAQFLSEHGIEIHAVDHDEAAQLGIFAAVPAGWQTLPEGQFPGATSVLVEPGLVENGFAPNAVLLVGRLSAAVDSESLLDCSFTDARVMPGWNEGVGHSEDLGGWPARFIRGSFMAEQLELAVTTRYAVVGAPEQYLVQLTVTVLADHADRLEFDVAVINDGLFQPVR